MKSIKLYLGDSHKITKDIVKANSVDCIFTTPPTFTKSIKDENSVNQYTDTMSKYFISIIDLLKPNGVLALDVLNIQGTTIIPRLIYNMTSPVKKYRYIMDIPIITSRVISGCGINFSNRKILLFKKVSASPTFKMEKELLHSYVWHENFPVSMKDYVVSSAIKNVKSDSSMLAYHSEGFLFTSRIIKVFCDNGGLMLDPFMGIGTSTLACMHDNVNFIGIELYDRIFKIAVENARSISPHTGYSVEVYGK